MGRDDHETLRISAESGTGTGVAMSPLMKTAEMPIKSPCDVDWASMNPRKTGRFCGDCKKVVQDLSSMKQADAKRRVAEAPEGLCIRYLHDEHGNIWFKDTPLVAAGNLLRKSASLVAAIALMPVLTACMGTAVDDGTGYVPPVPVVQPELPPITTPDLPDAGPDARKSADPVVETDGGTEADAAPAQDPDAAPPAVPEVP